MALKPEQGANPLGYEPLPKLLRGVDVCAEKDHNPGAGARRKLENATPGCARSTLEWLRATGSSCML